MNNEIQLLKDSLIKYIDKWEEERDDLPKTEENIKMHVKCNSQLFLAQWIINSINGGLDKPHATNICNILRKKDEN